MATSSTMNTLPSAALPGHSLPTSLRVKGQEIAASDRSPHSSCRSPSSRWRGSFCFWSYTLHLHFRFELLRCYAFRVANQSYLWGRAFTGEPCAATAHQMRLIPSLPHETRQFVQFDWRVCCVDVLDGTATHWRDVAEELQFTRHFCENVVHNQFCPLANGSPDRRTMASHSRPFAFPPVLIPLRNTLSCRIFS